MWRRPVAVIASTIAILLLAYGSMRALGQVYYAGERAGAAVSGPFLAGPAASFVEGNELRLHRTVTVRLAKLELAHAPRNVLFFFGLGALASLWLTNSIVLGLGLLWQFFDDRSWETAGMGLLFSTLLAPAMCVLALLFALSIYILALFQPCTPGYAIFAWPVGLFALLLGMGLGLRLQEELVHALTGWRWRSRRVDGGRSRV